MLKEIDNVLAKLKWMRAEHIWPNGLRYLWTDTFGVVLLVSLYEELREERYLDEAEWVVAEVERVLGRARGIRIGEEPDRDGQYFHYLSMWMYALSRLGAFKPDYLRKALDLVRQVHPAFVIPGLNEYMRSTTSSTPTDPAMSIPQCHHPRHGLYVLFFRGVSRETVSGAR